jgi:glycopeptide antibiotics resistance protein
LRISDAARRWRIAPRHRLALWVLIIIVIVFPWWSLQNHTHWQSVQWVPFVSPPIRLRDIIGNIALYVPFGWFYIRRDRASPLACVGWAFLLSLATELSQIYSHGRFPSVQDLLMNVIGAVIGVFVAQSRREGAQ